MHPPVVINPLTVIEIEWQNSTSWYGRLKIVLFYAYVLLYLVNIGYESFVPLGDKPCLQEILDKIPTEQGGQEATAWMRMVIRVENLWMLGFFLYVARGGPNFWNVIVMLLIILMAFLSSFVEKPNVDADCWQQVWAGWPLVLGWPIVVALLALVDEWSSRRTGGGGESTGLLEDRRSSF